jgi:hypothetical protein
MIKHIRLALTAISFLFSLCAGAQEERVVGLVSLPEVFGNEPCQIFTPKPISVYKEANERYLIGFINTTQNWTFPKEGGCLGLKVEFCPNLKSQKKAILPTLGYAYEREGAVVLEKKGKWVRIKTHLGSGWFLLSDRNKYFPIDSLLAQSTSYLTDDWDENIYDSPLGNSKKSELKHGSSVKILKSMNVNGAIWFQIKFPVADNCGSTDTTIRPGIGWIPAHSKENRLTMWFNSGGC